MKKLSELLPIDSNLMIEGIYSDSRLVKPNSIFFCIDGLTVDGHQFIENAIINGAICIVHTKELKYKHDDIIYYQCKDINAVLSDAANHFYDYPSKKMKIIGITGTAGKTSVAALVYQVSKPLKSMGYIGTGLLEYKDFHKEYQYTTPELIYLQKTLSEMVKADVDSVCIEVSSHGLSLKRTEGIDFDIAVCTDFYPDHIDFHGSLENYENSKLGLFRELKESGVAIFDATQAFSDKIREVTIAKQFTYAIEDEADLVASNLRLDLYHSVFDITYKNKTYTIDLPLIGEVNVNHALSAIATLLQLDLPMEQIIECFKDVQPIEGHYERILNDHDLNIIVDEAYHPNHYKALFQFVSKVHQKGRIIAVFGSVGKREFAKREQLGEIANKYADYIILTEEDSKGEDIESICKSIQKKITDKPNVIISNREMAIYQAIELSCPQDIILVIGKGRNKFMIEEDGIEEYIGDKQAILQAIDEIYGNEADDYD